MARSAFLSLLLLFTSPISAFIPTPKVARDILRRQTDIASACSALNSSLPGRVSFPGNSNYTTEMSHYWNEGLKSDTPSCIVQPESAQEVATSVTLLGQSQYQSVPFTVKSGGHDPNPGHSAINNGVIIALSHLNGTTYDAANNVAYVKPGGSWGDVISTLDQYDVTVVGGRLCKLSYSKTFLSVTNNLNAPVGLGGYLTGGGLSFLSTQYGFACDVRTSRNSAAKVLTKCRVSLNWRRFCLTGRLQTLILRTIRIYSPS